MCLSGGGGWGYIMVFYGDWTQKVLVSIQPIPLISLGCTSMSNAAFKDYFLKPEIQNYCKWWKLSHLKGREKMKTGKEHLKAYYIFLFNWSSFHCFETGDTVFSPKNVHS